MSLSITATVSSSLKLAMGMPAFVTVGSAGKNRTIGVAEVGADLLRLISSVTSAPYSSSIPGIDIDSLTYQIGRFVLRLVIGADNHLSEQTHEYKLNPHCEHDH